MTGLVWLKNANCNYADYAGANACAATLQNGMCGLTDNSSPGDWRLATKAEIEPKTVHHTVWPVRRGK